MRKAAHSSEQKKTLEHVSMLDSSDMSRKPPCVIVWSRANIQGESSVDQDNKAILTLAENTCVLIRIRDRSLFIAPGGRGGGGGGVGGFWAKHEILNTKLCEI